MKIRILLVFSCFSAFWVLLLVRVFFIQIFPHEKLERLESRQYETTVKIEGRRGSIYDRNGVELAISAPAYSLYADPQLLAKVQLKEKLTEKLTDKLTDKLTVARQLRKAIGTNISEFLKLVKDKKKRFVWIERQLSVTQMEKVKELNIQGLGFIEEPMRIYPDEDILKSILGVVGRTGQGLEGVEKQFDSTLRGNPKKLQVRRDAKGRPIQVNGLLVTEIEEGADVQLTLDREMQYVLHRELQRTLDEQEAQGALGVILDARTSEVLAMDGVGQSMSGEAFQSTSWRNRPILDAYEPGSTMKTFIIAAGLQQKGWQPNTRFNCEGGKLKIGKKYINEADTHHQFGWLSISEILAFSSNVGMAKMAFDLGEQSVKQILYNFGFGQKTGINLPGEAKGIIQEGKWSQHLLSNVSFGHGMAATPLQIANAYAAIANGGILNTPKIAKPLESKLKSSTFPWKKDTNYLSLMLGIGTQYDTSVDQGRRILSESEAQTLRLLLAGVVVKGGTGVSAVVPGYPVAGKTGTAQKVNPKGLGYLPDSYISSFVGMIPANEPRFVIYVAVDSPKKQYYGSQVAAPLFSRIATFAVRHDGVAPRWFNEQQAEGLLPALVTNKNFSEEKIKSVAIPNSDSHTADSEVNLMAMAPQLSLESSSGNQTQMPNLNQLTLREVQERLLNRNLNVKIHGSGRVSRFEPQEGILLNNKDKVEIWLTE